MFTNEEVTNLLSVLKDWRGNFLDFKDKINLCDDEERKNNLSDNMQKYFIDFHKICEEFICMDLEYLGLFDKKEYSHLGAMKEIRDNNEISNNFFNFYSKSIVLNALLMDEEIHIVPTDEELFLNLNRNLDTIDELDIAIRELLN